MSERRIENPKEQDIVEGSSTVHQKAHNREIHNVGKLSPQQIASKVLGEMAFAEYSSGSGGQTPADSGGQTPTGSGDRAPTGTGDRAPTGTGDRTPTGSGDRIPTGTGDRAPTGTGDRAPTGTGDEGRIPTAEEILAIQQRLAEQAERDRQAQQERQANETPEQRRERERAYDKFWEYVEPQIINQVREKMAHPQTFRDWIGNHRRETPEYKWNKEMREIERQYSDIHDEINIRRAECVVKISKERSIGALVALALSSQPEISDS